MVLSQLCSPISSCFPVLQENYHETYFNKLRTSFSTGEEYFVRVIVKSKTASSTSHKAKAT